MSIYATWLHLHPDEEHELTCNRWVPKVKGRLGEGEAEDWHGNQFTYQSKRRCTCDNEGPLVYYGSHVNPSADGKRGGIVEVGAIPNHCHPDARDGSDGAPVEFLRLCVDEHPDTYRGMEPGRAVVVLDRSHVVKLRDTLSAWLDSDDRY